MGSVDRAVSELATSQFGALSRAQAAAVGMTRAMLRNRLACGRVMAIGPRALVVAGAPDTWRQRLMVSCINAGDGAVVSHRAAAALWRFDGCHPGPVELTVPPSHRCRQADVTVHTTTALELVDITRIGPLPVTTPARTLVDLAAVVNRPALQVALDGALRDGAVRRPYLEWRLAELRSPGRGGSRALDALLQNRPRGPGPESWLERRFLVALSAAGLPLPRCQRQLGAARVDFLYEEKRVVVEVDGHRTHSTRQQRQADAERANRLLLAGYRVLRFTYEDLVERPSHVAAVVKDAVC